MKLRNIFAALAIAALAFVGCQEKERFLDEVKVSQSYLAFDKAGQSIDVTVNAIDKWEFTEVPEWITVDVEKLEGKVLSIPTREQIDTPVAEHLIVELYSK